MMNGVNGVSVVPVIKLQGNEQCTCPVETDCKCEKSEDEKVDPSLYGKIMQNLALATMMMNNRRSSLSQRNIEQMNMQVQQQNDMMNIKNLFINGGSLELAIATFKNISEEVIRKIYEEVVDAKTPA